MESPRHGENRTVERLVHGDENAFKEIYEQYAPGIYRVALRYLQSEELAEDLVQELFTAIWVKRAEFSRVQHFRFYLFRWARNLAIRHLNKLAQEDHTKKEFTERLELADNNAERYDNLLQKAVAQLPPRQKHIFHLAKEQGLNHEAIARMLNISPATVSNHMTAALKFIRTHAHHAVTSLVAFAIAFRDNWS